MSKVKRYICTSSFAMEIGGRSQFALSKQFVCRDSDVSDLETENYKLKIKVKEKNNQILALIEENDRQLKDLRSANSSLADRAESLKKLKAENKKVESLRASLNSMTAERSKWIKKLRRAGVNL